MITLLNFKNMTLEELAEAFRDQSCRNNHYGILSNYDEITQKKKQANWIVFKNHQIKQHVILHESNAMLKKIQLISSKY